MKKVLITDLDDTLYSWIEFFIPAFYAMVHELTKITGLEEAILLKEYKDVHQSKHNVEHPFSTLLLPSIKNMYPNMSDIELRNGPLKEAFHMFNRERKQRLKLYPGADEMLASLTRAGVKVIGFTDSFEENGYYRLVRLGVDNYFTKVYVYDRQFNTGNTYNTPHKVIHINKKKPDQDVLLKICKDEQIDINDAIYMGDSMTKDIYMSYCAGIDSIWIDKDKDDDLYNKLIAISHWTGADFRTEQEIKNKIEELHVKPTYTISDLSKVTGIILNN